MSDAVMSEAEHQAAKAEIATRIGQRLAEIYASGTLLGDDGQAYEIGDTSIPRHVGSFIADLIHSEKPHATLEVGMAWGVSTLFILQALFENRTGFRRHVVMDPYQGASFHNAARRSLRDLEITEAVEFYEEPSELLLPRLLQEKRTFDFAFIDGNHAFDCVFTDLRFVHKLLKPGGIVIFDDTNWDGVNLTCRFAETNYAYRFVAQVAATPRKPPRNRYGARRPRACAYRKPPGESASQETLLVPFFSDFVPVQLVTKMVYGTGRDLRHQGHMALSSGDSVLARQFFKLSLRADPTHFKTYLRLLRTYLPRRLASALGGTRRAVRS